MPRWSRWLLPIISGLLLALAYPPYTIPFVIWVAILPLLAFCFSAQSKKEAFLGGAITGLLFLSIVFEWIFATYPLEWAGLSPGIIPAFIVISIWLITSLVLALFVGLFGLISFLLIKRSHGIISALSIASIWVLLEHARAWGYGIFWWDRGAPLGPFWTFGWLGQALAETPFVSLAQLGGEPLLAFLPILVATLLFFIAINTVRRYLIYTLLIVIASSTIGSFILFRITPEPTGTLDVVLVQNNFSLGSRLNAKQLAAQIEAQLNALGDLAISLPSPPDLIVLPEGRGISWGNPSDTQTKKFLIKLWGENHPTLIESVPFKNENDQFFMQMLITDKNRPYPDIVYRKQLLIPGGETIPFLIHKTFELFGKDNLIKKFNGGRTMTRGEENYALRSAPSEGTSYGAIICSGIISPSHNRLVVRDGAEILIISSSYGVFSENKSIIAQSKASAILKAVENQRYFLQSANAGKSFIISPNGVVRQEAPDTGFGRLTGRVNTISKKTIATRMGDWILLLFAGILMFGVKLHRKT